jgi:hypothetical protein
MSKMSWVSAWVAVVEANGSLPSILEDMTLDELEYISDVALNLDRQARRVWYRKLAQDYQEGNQ